MSKRILVKGFIVALIAATMARLLLIDFGTMFEHGLRGWAIFGAAFTIVFGICAVIAVVEQTP